MKQKLIYIALLIVFTNIPDHTQANTFELRHKFAPGQQAQAVTNVAMEGQSILLGESADTKLKMKMFKIFQVNNVDSFGNALMRMEVKRIQTQGKFNGTPMNQDVQTNKGTQSEFDETLEGQKLNQLLFGAAQTELKVSPKGHVMGQGGSSLGGGLGGSLGAISLPSSVGATGGFEFPTFPNEAVRVGAYWDQHGNLVNRSAVNQKTKNSWVYNLFRVQNSPNGRVAIIRYKKVTDFSGLNLGGGLLGGASGGGMLSGMSGASANVGGLVIELEGEIEFNINQGLVQQSTQMGTWDLKMESSSNQQNKPARLEQKGMKIRIQTQFQWNEVRQEPQQPRPQQQPQNQLPNVNLPENSENP